MNWDRYLGLPYVEKGRTMEGVDCYGLVYLIYKQEFGIVLPTYCAEYECAMNVDIETIRHCYIGWRELPPTARPQIGDVATFVVKGSFHVGLMTDVKMRKMLHITSGRNVTQERIDSIIWRRTFQGIWHYDR